MMPECSVACIWPAERGRRTLKIVDPETNTEVEPLPTLPRSSQSTPSAGSILPAVNGETAQGTHLHHGTFGTMASPMHLVPQSPFQSFASQLPQQPPAMLSMDPAGSPYHMQGPIMGLAQPPPPPSMRPHVPFATGRARLSQSASAKGVMSTISQQFPGQVFQAPPHAPIPPAAPSAVPMGVMPPTAGDQMPRQGVFIPGQAGLSPSTLDMATLQRQLNSHAAHAAKSVGSRQQGRSAIPVTPHASSAGTKVPKSFAYLMHAGLDRCCQCCTGNPTQDAYIPCVTGRSCAARLKADILKSGDFVIISVSPPTMKICSHLLFRRS